MIIDLGDDSIKYLIKNVLYKRITLFVLIEKMIYSIDVANDQKTTKDEIKSILESDAQIHLNTFHALSSCKIILV